MSCNQCCLCIKTNLATNGTALEPNAFPGSLILPPPGGECTLQGVVRWETLVTGLPLENALQSGAIWKRCFLKTLFSSVDGGNEAIWKRWRHQNRHDRGPDHSTMSIQNGAQTLPCGFNFAQFRGPKYWNAQASRSFEHVHWGYNSVFKTDTAL